MLRPLRLSACASAVVAVLLHCRWVLLNGASVPYRLWTVLGTFPAASFRPPLPLHTRLPRSYRPAATGPKPKFESGSRDPHFLRIGNLVLTPADAYCTQSAHFRPSCGRSCSSRQSISRQKSDHPSVFLPPPPGMTLQYIPCHPNPNHEMRLRSGSLALRPLYRSTSTCCQQQTGSSSRPPVSSC